MHPSPRPDDAAGIYVRRSAASDRDTYQNRSLAEQEAEGRAWAAEAGLTIVATFPEEEGTGASRHSRKARPQWEAALAALRDGSRFRTLIVYEISRADRRGAAQVAALLDEHAVTGRRLYIVDDRLDSADERDRRRIIDKAESAREESERLSKRIQRTKGYRRADGNWLGGTAPIGLIAVTPPGETARTALAIDPETYPVARRIAEMLLAGLGARAIANRLNGDGIRPLRAALWRPGTITNLARSPAWAGLQSSSSRRARDAGWRASGEVLLAADGQPVRLKAVVDGQRADPGSARVITPDERAAILAQLAGRTAATTAPRAHAGGWRHHGKRPNSSLLGGSDGLLRCPACNGRLDYTGARPERAYRCPDNGSCDGVTIPAVPLDTFVAAQFMAVLLFSPDDSPLVRRVASRVGARMNPDAGRHRTDAQATIDHARAEIERIEDLLIDGRIGDKVADRRRAAALAAIAAAESRLASIVDTIPTGADLRAQLSIWDDLPIADRRALLADAIGSIVPRKIGRGRKVPIPDRVTIEWVPEAVAPSVAAFRAAVGEPRTVYAADHPPTG